MFLGTSITIDDVILCTRSEATWGGRGVICHIKLPTQLYSDVFQYLEAKKISDLINKLKTMGNIKFTRHLLYMKFGKEDGVIVYFRGTMSNTSGKTVSSPSISSLTSIVNGSDIITQTQLVPISVKTEDGKNLSKDTELCQFVDELNINALQIRTNNNFIDKATGDITPFFNPQSINPLSEMDNPFRRAFTEMNSKVNGKKDNSVSSDVREPNSTTKPRSRGKMVKRK